MTECEAWRFFEETGNIIFYLLYKKIINKPLDIKKERAG
jgi:hypothetical protein